MCGEKSQYCSKKMRFGCKAVCSQQLEQTDMVGIRFIGVAILLHVCFVLTLVKKQKNQHSGSCL